MNLNPNDRNGQASDTMGWILYKRGEYPRALALLRQSSDRQPNAPDVLYHLGMAHYMMGEQDPARMALNEALAKGDFDGREDASNSLAILTLDARKAGAADRAQLEKQLKARPGDSIALMKLATIEEQAGEFEKAAGHYAAAVKQNPQDVAAMVPLARLYFFQLKEPQKGLELARAAHKAAPDDPNVSALLGRLVFQAPEARDRDFPYSLELLQDAARTLTDQPDLLHDLAWAWFSTGNTNQAQATKSGALATGAQFQKLDDAKQFLAMLAAGWSDKPEAASQVQKVLQADANYAPALLAWGLINERQGKTKDAEDSYEKILATYPSFSPARRQLGILYTREGNNAKAYENLEKARVAFPDDRELIRDSGLVASQRKDYQKSKQWLDQSIRDYPKDAEVYYYLGMDYSQLNEPAKARTNLQYALLLKLPDNLATNANLILKGIK
jgi:tetratricopeptide (TPR) repeat protein